MKRNINKKRKRIISKKTIKQFFKEHEKEAQKSVSGRMKRNINKKRRMSLKEYYLWSIEKGNASPFIMFLDIYYAFRQHFTGRTVEQKVLNALVREGETK